MMFPYQFECRSCEKKIEFRETPLFPTCPICHGALDIEASFDGVSFTPIPHAVLVDQEIDQKMLDFISMCSGVDQRTIQTRLHSEAEAQHMFYNIKALCTQMLRNAADGEDAVSRSINERHEQMRIDQLMNDMLNGELQNTEALQNLDLEKGDESHG